MSGAVPLCFSVCSEVARVCHRYVASITQLRELVEAALLEQVCMEHPASDLNCRRAFVHELTCLPVIIRVG